MNSLDKMEDYDRLKQERDELAAQVEVMRDALDGAAAIDEFGEDLGCRLRLAVKARSALSITPSAALREIEAMAMDAVGDEFAHRQNLHGEVVSRQMAAAKRKGEP